MIDDAALPTGPERRSRRVVLWGVLAVLAVGIGAVAVVAGRDGGGTDALGARRLPIALGSGAAGGAERQSAPAAADMAMMAYVHYTAGDDLPTLGGDGHAYRLTGEVDLSALRTVARALGLEGEPREEPEAEGSWTIQSGDRTLSASEYGGGSWWYAEQAAVPEDLVARDDAAAKGEPGCEGGPDQSCSSPAFDPGSAPLTTTTVFVPPADLPSKDEAQRIALDLFRRLGVDLAGADVSVEGPYDAWYVNAIPRIGGLPVSGYGFSASVGSNGEIVNASGILSQPEDLGTYPTVDTRTAIDRLNDGSAFGGTGAGAREAASDVPATAVADAPMTAPTLSAPACPPVEGSDVYPPCPAEIPPSDPNLSQPPTPIEVVLDRAEPILVLVGASDGSPDGYLVPGYRFRGDGDTVVDVPSIDDAALLPTPTTAPEASKPSAGSGAGSSGSSGASTGSAGGAAPADQ
jgi:hypothetical protein